MKSIVIKNEREFKNFVEVNRKDISTINNIKFSENYPIITATNSNVYYYDVVTQNNKFIYPPFNIDLK